jgi:hypothetical protein
METRGWNMKIITGLLAVGIIGVSGAAFAQNAPLSGGATNPPPGTTNNSTGTPLLPESTTNTAKPSALDSANTTGAHAAAKTKFEEAGFSNVKGLSRTTDGVWTGRAVKGGVEVGVAMDPSGRITTQ